MSVIFINNSKSTNADEVYWRHVKSIVSMTPAIQYVFWNSNVYVTNRRQILHRATHAWGHGISEPKCIAEFIVKHRPTQVTIVTCGSTTIEQIRECDRILSCVNLSTIKFTIHALETRSGLTSRTYCAFIRGGQYAVFTYAQSGLIDHRIGISIDEIETFDRKKLAEWVTSKCAYVDDTTTARLQLHAFYTKLVTDRMNAKFNLNSETIVIDRRFDLGAFDEVVKCVNGMHAYLRSDDVREINNCISALLNYTSNSECDAVDFTAREDLEIEICIVYTAYTRYLDLYPNATIQFECPIVCDNQLPCVPIYEARYDIFAEVSAEQIKQIRANPLLLITFPDVLTKLVSTLAHPIGVKSYDYIRNQGRLIDPFDRKIISHNAIHSEISDARDEETSKALDQLSGDKDPLNRTVYLACIVWAVCHGIIPYDGFATEEIKNAFVRILRHRLLNSEMNLFDDAPVQISVGAGLYVMYANRKSTINPMISELLHWIIVDVLLWPIL